MGLEHIVVFVIVSLVALFPFARVFLKWYMFVVSLVAIYWLQPALNIRWLDYSLPTATLVITFIFWLIVQQKQSNSLQREDWIALSILVVTILILTGSRYINLPFEVTTRPPETTQVVIVLSMIFFIILLTFRLFYMPALWLHYSGLIVLVSLLLVVKTDSLGRLLSLFLRQQTGQDVALASAVDIQWLGFSYVAFRLIHTLRDAMSGILPSLTLREYISYVIFFPAYTAGPIDRAERFVANYRQLSEIKTHQAGNFAEATTRLTIGLFKKFVIADSLSIISLNSVSASQATSPLSLWIMLYAYAFQIFFDFSGYSDIAIGIGLMIGIRLPENFNQPYQKSNITAFWQSWHITLSHWVRFYVYSPLSRNLLRRQKKMPNEMIILVCALATMSVIGLWHGVSLPFLFWGVWHGIGLFIHKLWSDRTRKWYRQVCSRPQSKKFWHLGGWLLTFHFVALGWVWFVMPDLDSALATFRSLFGR